MNGLSIKEVAERTGMAAATIRAWEQRYGFPAPERASSGYRVYSEADVHTLRRVVALRETGLSVPAALERAQTSASPTDRPSLFGAVNGEGTVTPPQLLRKRTLLAISQAIEDETLARAAGPVVFGAFQHERNFRAVEHRYARLARSADAVVVFADFPELRAHADGLVEVPVAPGDALGNEWAVVVDAPGYSACLLGWEQPASAREQEGRRDGDRRFEALWTLDPRVVRRATRVGAALVGRVDPQLGRRLEETLADRPLATEVPAPGLTALTNRIVSYLET